MSQGRGATTRARRRPATSTQRDPGPERRERRPQQRSARTRERLLEAALEIFGAVGFEGASTREIARRAQVALAALPYHFTTKDALWRAAADRIFRTLVERLDHRRLGLDRVAAPKRLRLVLGEFVRFSAAHPELHRFMVQEGFQPSPRLDWLVETHVRPMYDLVRTMVGSSPRSALASRERPEHLHYALVGAATAPYVLRAEFEHLTGRDPCAESAIEAHVALLERMLLPETRRRPEPSERRRSRRRKRA